MLGGSEHPVGSATHPHDPTPRSSPKRNMLSGVARGSLVFEEG
jgi:hypothetical protein